eukprot:CAMPEP_0113709802 /NCGR_PEP_ID=MMETSP0038_2-20120614/29785_1 /TAXON_ID=2898 /ORGANISM="Cryptomonas paramecium" /LENGTH=393 /DNA_ID=CAMNT_0000635751 /DNA_START=171 /DNA_END=1349 /DNA_ORIENTATION=- /assembly_acc=CAM_ASM_000170
MALIGACIKPLHSNSSSSFLKHIRTLGLRAVRSVSLPLGFFSNAGQSVLRNNFRSNILEQKLSSTVPTSCHGESNPLLLLEDANFPRYDEVGAHHIKSGISALIHQTEQNLLAFEKDLAASDTMPAHLFLKRLETVPDALSRAWGVCSHLKAVRDSEDFRLAYDEMQPQYVALSLKLSQSVPIFQALKAIRSSSSWDSLPESQRRIIESEIQEAELSGVGLRGAEKLRFNEIETELAKLSTQFSNNLLDATKAFSLRLTRSEEVSGLPQSALSLAAQIARGLGDAEATAERGPWILTLDMPLYLPAMQYARDRSLRERLFRAYQTRASELDEATRDNTPVALRILVLRRERAQLLGMANHVEVSMATKMATPEAALALVERLRAAAWPAAQRE